jgi:hypothetical protein
LHRADVDHIVSDKDTSSVTIGIREELLGLRLDGVARSSRKRQRVVRGEHGNEAHDDERDYEADSAPFDVRPPLLSLGLASSLGVGGCSPRISIIVTWQYE